MMQCSGNEDATRSWNRGMAFNADIHQNNKHGD